MSSAISLPMDIPQHCPDKCALIIRAVTLRQ
jgi:hypothetical protein